MYSIFYLPLYSVNSDFLLFLAGVSHALSPFVPAELVSPIVLPCSSTWGVPRALKSDSNIVLRDVGALDMLD